MFPRKTAIKTRSGFLWPNSYQPGSEKFKNFSTNTRDSKNHWVQGLPGLWKRSVRWYMSISQSWRNAASDEFFGSRYQALFEATAWVGADYELYDLNSDPYELSNLLFSNQEVCWELAKAFQFALQHSFLCRTQDCWNPTADDELMLSNAATDCLQ